MEKVEYSMSKDLKTKIKEDLLKSGFPLELEISRKLEDREWNVLQNEYISEEEKDQEYEIDILGIKMFEKDINGTKFKLFPKLIIECKKAEKHPWVFFTREKQAVDKPHRLIKQVSNFGVNRPFRLPNHKFYYDFDYLGNEIDFIGLNTFSWKTKATSYCQAFRDPNKENQVYKAIRSLLRNLRIIKNKQNKSLSQGQWSEIILEIYFPIIVLDGNLFEGYLDKEELEINEIDYIPLVINSGENDLQRVLVQIVKKDYVEALIDNIKKDCETLIDGYSKINYTKAN